MKISDELRDKVRQSYHKHKALIEKRQAFERSHPVKPDYQTTIMFLDLEGESLLEKAILIEDMEAIKTLIEHHQFNVHLGKNPPVAVALWLGNIAIAEYLLKHGASILSVEREQLDEEEAIMFYDAKVRERIKAVMKTDRVLRVLLDGSKKSVLTLASEIGDCEVLQKGAKQFSLKKTVRFICHDLMHKAAVNNQMEVIKYLLEQKVNIDSYVPGNETPLHQAVLYGRWGIVEYLLQQGAEVNAQDQAGATPLFYAIQAGSKEGVDVLMQYNPDLSIRTYLNESILHAQVRSGLELPSSISDSEAFEALKRVKTIYGESPEDYRTQRQVIRLDQSQIIKRIRYFLKLHYRDTEFFSNGYCNGLTFLWHYYDSFNNLDEFYATLEAWSSWDGNPAALEDSPDSPFLKHYETLYQLFEIFLGQVTLFQMDIQNAIPLRQTQRSEQLALLEDEIGLHYYFEKYRITVNQAQIEELFNIFKSLPPNTRIEIGGERHATGLKLNQAYQYVYFDPNFAKRIDTSYDSEALTKLIIDTKYKSLIEKTYIRNMFENDDGDEIYDLSLLIYHYERDYLPAAFNYFSVDDLPKSKQETQSFIDTSANGFNHLFVALLTNSEANFRALVQAGHCDLNYRLQYHFNTTVLEMAYDLGNRVFFEILLNAPEMRFEPDQYRNLLQKLYDNGDTDLIQIILHHPNTSNFGRFFISAAWHNDLVLVQQLISQDKLDMKEMFPAIVDILDSQNISGEIKQIIFGACQAQSDENKKNLAHHASERNKIDAFIYIIEAEPSWLKAVDKDNNTPLRYLCEHAMFQAQMEGGSTTSHGKAFILVLQHLPESIDSAIAFDLLMLFYRPSYKAHIDRIESIYEAMGSAQSPLQNSSIFKQRDRNSPYTALLQDAVNYIDKEFIIRGESKEALFAILKHCVKMQADLDSVTIPEHYKKNCVEFLKALDDTELQGLVDSQVQPPV